MKTVHRFVVLLDDNPHKITLSGDPLKVAAHGHAAVEFWAEVGWDGPGPRGRERTVRDRYFQVFGTSHPVPESAKYWGTTDRNSLGLVWHLYELEVQ